MEGLHPYGQTAIHPLALLLTLAMGVAICLVRRDQAVVPLLIIACLVTHAQRVVVGELDFSMLRVIILFGWARILFRGETQSYRYHSLDAVLPLWQALATFAYIVGPRASEGSFVLRLGLTLDSLGMYFLFRVMLRDVRDVQRSVGAFSWIAMAMVVPMVVENLTGRNAFSILGGVSEITRIRGGRLRCQASFSHPIMAGNFGATTAALVAALWLARPGERIRHGIAFVSASGVAILSASSGPLMAWLALFLGWGLWPYRRQMRRVLWGTLAVLVVIHFAREQPVWHLIARLASLTGGTGYHRFKLIDEAIAHFDEWWLIGTASTAHWKMSASSDITNQYILEGVRGGLPAFLSFVAVIVVGFRTVGRSVRLAFSGAGLSPGESREAALLGWGLGVCLFVHSVAFIGVSYFGQLMAIFYLHMAMIPSLACALSRSHSRARRSKAPLPQTPGDARVGAEAGPAQALQARSLPRGPR